MKEKLRRLSLNPRICVLTDSEIYPSWRSKICHIFICPKTIQTTVIDDKLNAPIQTDNITIAPTDAIVVRVNSDAFEILELL